MSILFYTCANSAYEDFAPLYAYSVLRSVEDSSLEIGVESLERFLTNHGRSIALIHELFGDKKVKMRNVGWALANGQKIIPNSVRFISAPESQAKYIYIGDIDIIMLDDAFLAKHVKAMEATGLPYSNSVRPGTKRMSGLHFASMDRHYPLPDLSDLSIGTMNDEELLYEIIRRRNMPILPDRWFRPTHGIHMSPNRPVVKVTNESGIVIPGWGIDPYKKHWLSLAAEPGFKRLRGMLSLRLQNNLALLERTYGKAV